MRPLAARVARRPLPPAAFVIPAEVVARLAGLATDTKTSVRVVEADASALDRVAVGDRSVAPATVEALLAAAAARRAEKVALSVAEALARAATELQPAVLNYAHFYEADGESLEAARVSAAASTSSDVIDALEPLVPLVSAANAKELVAVVMRSATAGVGVPARVATARFVRSLTAARATPRRRWRRRRGGRCGRRRPPPPPSGRR